MKKVGHVTSATKARGRARFAAVKRSACRKCLGAWWDRALAKPEVTAPAFLCECPDGWEGTETNLGVIADSGPTRLIPRLFWQLGQWIAGVIERIQQHRHSLRESA